MPATPEFAFDTVETTTLAGLVHITFDGLIHNSRDGRPIHAAWRERLKVTADEDLYDALSLIRRTILALVAQVSASPRIKDANRPRHQSVVQGFANATTLEVMPHQMSSLHSSLNDDRMHALSTLDELLHNEDPLAIPPTGPLVEFMDILRAIRADLDSLDALPPTFRDHVRRQIDRLLWTLGMAGILGADAVFETAVQAFSALRHLPPVPETAGPDAAALSERLQSVGRRIFAFLDAVETARKRATNAGYLFAGAGITVAGLLRSRAGMSESGSLSAR
ncbi:hypothetical protein [Azospirillum griseum]|uniref:Uncharacterized protein n=1 Tax=Azospirillum griseum TaxID=2496639 RepID=A0A431V9K2_9PROT|nr:hypothetical protein [Azospirillum griseum]RTR11998.1 hypothetical protein EJ903_25760 [Azospirillum griseum]